MKAIYTLAAMLLAANVAVAATPKKKHKTTTPAATATPAPSADSSLQKNDTPAAAATPAPAPAPATHMATGAISEYHHHAMGGQTEVTPAIGYFSNTSNIQGGNGSDKLSGLGVGVKAEYGLMDRMGVGLALQYDSLKFNPNTGTSTNGTGLENPILYAHGSSEMGEGRLAYGLDLGIPAQQRQSKINGDFNVASGGFSATPYVGYEMMAGPGTWGAQLNYNWLGDRTTTYESGAANTTQKAGSALGLATFYEYGLSDTAKIGAALSYAMAAATTDQNGNSNNDANNTLGIRIYAPIGIATNTTLIPRLDWKSTNFTNSSYGYQTATVLTPQVAARFIF